jgi:hypothetical protein
MGRIRINGTFRYRQLLGTLAHDRLYSRPRGDRESYRWVTDVPAVLGPVKLQVLPADLSALQYRARRMR